MAYTPTVWKNGEFPPIDAEHLNKIEQGIADAVSVTPQSLSDAQKEQARGNINAAPGGFGLGETIPPNATTGSAGAYDADTITKSCAFFAKTNTPTNDWCFGLCISRDPNRKLQIMWSEQGSGSWSYDGCYAERIMKAGIWGPWEWVNPPMELGVEYRTTERYLGKPVYVKVVDCGALPNNTTKNVSLGIDNPEYLVGIWGRGSKNTNIPSNNYGGGMGTGNIVAIWTNLIDVYISTDGDRSSNFAVVTVKYTKTTD